MVQGLTLLFKRKALSKLGFEQSKVRFRIFVVMSLLLSSSVHATQTMAVKTTRTSDGIAQHFEFVVHRNLEKSLTIVGSEQSEKLPNQSMLYSEDAGTNIYLYQKHNQSCQQFVGGDFSKAAGTTMMQLIDRFDVEMSKLNLSKIHEKESNPILGYPIQETHWRLTFDITLELMFKELTWHITRDIKLWKTQDPKLPLTPLIIQPSFPETGFEILDNVVLEALKQTPGFPLKSEFVQHIDAPMGNPPQLSLIQTVESIQVNEAFPDVSEIINSDCRPVTKKALKEEGKGIMWMLYGKPIK